MPRSGPSVRAGIIPSSSAATPKGENIDLIDSTVSGLAATMSILRHLWSANYLRRELTDVGTATSEVRSISLMDSDPDARSWHAPSGGLMPDTTEMEAVAAGQDC